MRGRVLWSKVEYDLVCIQSFFIFHTITCKRAIEQSITFGNPLFRIEVLWEFQIILQRIFFLCQIELTIGPAALEWLEIFLVKTFFPIFAKGMSFIAFPHEDTTQIRVPYKSDSKQIPGFALLIIHAGESS